MAENNVTLHRVLKASPEKVYRAFTEPAAMAAWLPPYGYVCTVQEMDVRVGGAYRMTFQTFDTGKNQAFGGKYDEIKPNEFLKYTDSFDDPNMPGEITTSVWLKKNSAGTDLKITQENIPEMIPAEMCYMGWEDSLEKLKRLVEAESKDV